jgi:hypothetical protein
LLIVGVVVFVPLGIVGIVDIARSSPPTTAQSTSLAPRTTGLALRLTF